MKTMFCRAVQVAILLFGLAVPFVCSAQSDGNPPTQEQTSTEPERRALPAPLDGVFPGSD